MSSNGSVVRPEVVREWGQQLDKVVRRIETRFARSETRDRVRAYLIALLAPVQRRTLGSSPNRSAITIPTACSICWAGPNGTPIWSATTSGPTSSRPSATPRPS